MTSARNADLRTATDSDVPAIVDLVNRAFAVELFFKTGDRTDPAQVRELMRDGQFLVLTDGASLTSCVYVKLNGDRCYIGLLSVDPATQKSGIGARMMREAEDLGRRAGCRFADRCPRVMDICRTQEPPDVSANGRLVKCHLYADQGV